MRMDCDAEAPIAHCKDGPSWAPHTQEHPLCQHHTVVLKMWACCVLCCFSHVWHFVTPRTVAHQALLSMGFSRQEYWSGLLCPPPGDLPNRGIKPRSPTLQADSLPAQPLGKPKNTGVGSLSLLQGIFLTQNQTQVSHIVGRFFTSWVARKVPVLFKTEFPETLRTECVI